MNQAAGEEVRGKAPIDYCPRHYRQRRFDSRLAPDRDRFSLPGVI